MKTVGERLAELGRLYTERRAVYGKTDKTFGQVMTGLFPDGMTLRTVEDFNRAALVFHVVDKVGRYATSFLRGGHADSMDDIAVYSQMLREADDEIRKGEAL